MICVEGLWCVRGQWMRQHWDRNFLSFITYTPKNLNYQILAPEMTTMSKKRCLVSPRGDTCSNYKYVYSSPLRCDTRNFRRRMEMMPTVSRSARKSSLNFRLATAGESVVPATAGLPTAATRPGGGGA